ncbi:hypothetical protein FS749_014922 [Ceratobasidium sp. UAMH 11750]|nr:hypothetical protein FS749_014922 [Ceratobasidium sp. UAMH 11750]
MVAASITLTGGLLAMTLDRDGGPHTTRVLSSGIDDPVDSVVNIVENGLTNPIVEIQAMPTPSIPTHPIACPNRRVAESAPLWPASGAENYGAIERSTPASDQADARVGVPLGERTWTQSSALSGGSGYGDMYRSRFGVGVRHRVSTTSWISAVARRNTGADDSGETHGGGEPEEREPRLAERLLMANELTVTSIGDLWVASALTMDAEEDEDVEDPNDHFVSAEDALESQHSSAISEGTARARSAEPRARSVSASRRTVRSVSGAAFRNHHPHSLALSTNNSTSHLVSYPAILYNTGLRSPSPAFNLISEAPDTSSAPNVDVLQPIFEGKPAGFEAQQVETGEERKSLYGLLALHSTTHDQVFMSYLVSERDRGGLQLTAGDFAQLIAVMCFAQIVFQFYFYPTMGPPLGRFSHLSMFRIGGVLMGMSYLGVILVRPLAKSGASGTTILTALGLPTAIRYCGITFSYTAVAVLLNYMSPPHAIGLANGLAQSVVSLARFMGPVGTSALVISPLLGDAILIVRMTTRPDLGGLSLVF